MVEWQGRRVDVLSITGASPDALLVRPGTGQDRVYAVMEAKSRVPFMKLQGNEKGTSCLHNAALELSVIHVVTRAFRTGPSAWSYNPTSRPHDEMDIAHIVQVQLQMHATGARVGYLCSWSVANGSKIFKMKYSEEFMRGASEVLQQVVQRYLQPGNDTLPKCDITQEDDSMQVPWYRMMHALGDCAASAEVVGFCGKFSPTMWIGHF